MKHFHVDKDVIHYGLRDGKLVHIDNVTNGQSCNCICPSCQEPLIAHNKPGIKVTPHFQHKSKVDCWNSYETTLHYLAKEIIEEEKYITVPDSRFRLFENAYYYSYEVDSIELEIKQTKLDLSRVEIEKKEGAIRPDIIGFVGDKVCYIEIAVTHFIDDEKKKRIIKRNVPTLEIDLSKFNRLIKKDELKKLLLTGIENKNWIYNPKNIDRYRNAEKLMEPIKFFVSKNKRNLKVYGANKIVYNCPVYFSNVRQEEECKSCRYLAGEWEGDKYIDHEKVKYPSLTIDCIGHVADGYDELLAKLKVI